MELVPPTFAPRHPLPPPLPVTTFTSVVLINTCVIVQLCYFPVMPRLASLFLLTETGSLGVGALGLWIPHPGEISQR